MTPSESMEILEEFNARQGKLSEPPKQKKNYFFVGHLFARIVRDHIKRYVISKPYDFVLGPLWVQGLEYIQWDGALVKKDAPEIFERYYKQNDIIALFEFKASGIYGTKSKRNKQRTVKEVVSGIKSNFVRARRLCPELRGCFYVALHERTPKRKGSIHYFDEVKKLEPAVTTCMLFDSVSLEGGREPFEYRDEWPSLVVKLGQI